MDIVLHFRHFFDVITMLRLLWGHLDRLIASLIAWIIKTLIWSRSQTSMSAWLPVAVQWGQLNVTTALHRWPEVHLSTLRCDSFLRFPLQRVVVVLTIAKVARVCCAASTNECHTLATLVVAHGSVQQPGHNPVAVPTCCSQSPLPYTVNMHEVIRM